MRTLCVLVLSLLMLAALYEGLDGILVSATSTNVFQQLAGRIEAGLAVLTCTVIFGVAYLDENRRVPEAKSKPFSLVDIVDNSPS